MTATKNDLSLQKMLSYMSQEDRENIDEGRN